MTFEAVTYESIPHALISGIAISILCSAVGLFLVLRKFSLFGDALAHSAFGGVAFGLFIGIYPLWIACGVAILSALGLTTIRQKFDISSDAIVAILLATGLGAGVILVSMSDDLDLHDIEEFLFGSAIINTQSVIEILGLSGGILAILFFTYKKLLYSTFSEEQAKAAGIPVDKMSYLLIAMAGVTVIISMQLVGVLLISALFVLPNVSAMLYARSFKQTMFLSMSFAVFATVSGIIISYQFDIAQSGCIVLVAAAIFVGSLIVKSTGLIKTAGIIAKTR
ncbi:MAG: metal ABC transporter permease [Candidatus Nitrosopelagicus sp.]|nr:metal ABC transporter permease [Candidatus Nitrosopelagicus sp.]